MIQNVVLNTGKQFLTLSNFSTRDFFSSVIHPEEYEKRYLKFLFEKVFINSNQTLEELLASPPLPELPPDIEGTFEQPEPFEIIQATSVLQDLTLQRVISTDSDQAFSESTPL